MQAILGLHHCYNSTDARAFLVLCWQPDDQRNKPYWE